MLTLQQIIDAQDATVRKVEVPEWGGSVFVRSLPSLRKDQYDAGNSDEAKRANLRARFVGWCLCNESGEFLAADGDDLAGALGAKSATAIGRIFREAAKLNGLSEEAIEAAEKN